MTTVKRITDLTPYASVLPYASELFGVYQPLLGWKSRRIEKRFQAGLSSRTSASSSDRLTRQFAGVVTSRTRTAAHSTSRSSPGS